MFAEGPLHNDVTPIMDVLDPRTHPVRLGQVSLDPPTHPLNVTSFIVHKIVMGVRMRTPQKRSFKFYSKFYVECEIE